ncbi:MAG: AAA family ATPase [Luteolibacter sp.]
MSSLDKLTIRGFKSIRALEDFELKSLNLFIGANGAGKSNLISFFRMLHAFVDGNMNAYVTENGGMSDLLFNGRKVTASMYFETHFGPRGHRFTLKPERPKNRLSSMKLGITPMDRMFLGGRWVVVSTANRKSPLRQQV